MDWKAKMQVQKNWRKEKQCVGTGAGEKLSRRSLTPSEYSVVQEKDQHGILKNYDIDGSRNVHPGTFMMIQAVYMTDV